MSCSHFPKITNCDIKWNVKRWLTRSFTNCDLVGGLDMPSRVERRRCFSCAASSSSMSWSTLVREAGMGIARVAHSTREDSLKNTSILITLNIRYCCFRCTDSNSHGLIFQWSIRNFIQQWSKILTSWVHSVTCSFFAPKREQRDDAKHKHGTDDCQTSRIPSPTCYSSLPWERA